MKDADIASSSGGEKRTAGGLEHVGAPSPNKGRQFGARAVKRGVVATSLPRYVEAAERPLTARVTSTKRALLKRMGLRMNELTWAGREVLGLYASTLSKMRLIDEWLATHGPIDDDGKPAPVLALYNSFSNTASRQLGLLRQVVEAMAAEDSRYDAALEALIETGRKTKAGRGEL